jgi:hypothetical protein
MMICMQSPLTGEMNAMEIPITEDDHRLMLNPFRFIPALFPHLTEEQVEFLATGATPSDRYYTDMMAIEMARREHISDPYEWEDIPF